MFGQTTSVGTIMWPATRRAVAQYLRVSCSKVEPRLRSKTGPIRDLTQDEIKDTKRDLNHDGNTSSVDIKFLGIHSMLTQGRTRSELVNCANGPLLQHENFLNIRGVSPEQDTIRHQTMETAKINQSGSFDVR
ncbi:hypothetical protein EVAR_90528_1 [Eumeta japonica]|uniref:Uncharacterized protein n=1 Tax=Eumeta variegata TaxID=151549 RepID=A0A4C1XVT1_EUMVA|nr:hypothetical protein EVAR_90528_1 [Eumeta japonica]